MNEDITRVVRLKSQPSTPDGTFSEGETDNGFKFVTVEKPWDDDKPDTSCVPRPARKPCRYQYSEKHKRDLYHVLLEEPRTVIEIHAANVHEQLLGCFAPGARFETFAAGSIHPGVPSRDMKGVIASGATLEAFNAAMKNPVTGNQDPFWLEIS